MKKLMIAVGVSVLLSACAGGMGSSGNSVSNGGSGSMSMPMANPMVGGAAMYPTKDIVDNAVNSKDHTTLVAAVKAAGLVDTLKGSGPFTVFAPTNEAFAALPSGTVDTLLKPENKPTLTKVLTYHVVPGKMDGPALMSAITAGGGKATLKTASGGTLTATMSGRNVMVSDAKGGTATVSIANVYQSNGVIHVVDKVLLPG
ncbi:fasciclin domain-containing protein [Variovorax rhizosphaerae]